MLFKSIKSLFQKNPNKRIKDNADSSKSKMFMSKLSGAFMLPISLMSIAGLFIGIGSAIGASDSAAETPNETIEIISGFLGSIGWPAFIALPALFLVAVIIAFTDDIGIPVFAGLVGFLIFNSIQGPFINIDTITNEQGININTAEILGIHTSIDISKKMYGIVGTNLGFESLNTSIFGGIVVGFISVYIYNKFKDIKLPTLLSFYSGRRFVAIAMMLSVIPLAFLFLLIWPWIGLGFAYFGEYSGKVAGLDSFIFNFIERALVPFGLHHVLTTTLNFSSAGGDIYTQFMEWSGTIISADGKEISNIDFINQIIQKDGKYISYLGDRNGWLAVTGSPFTNITYTYEDWGDKTSTMKILNFFDKEIGLNLGRFQMIDALKQFALPAAALAMVMAAPKERRKEALAICLPAAISAFLVGITEPIEFTFLFLSPFLFWGFHTTMSALMGLASNFAGVHVGDNGGLIGGISFAILPVAKGTNFWWQYVIGLSATPIYFFVFYWWIKHFNLTTPGRGQSTDFITKKVYNEMKAKMKKEKSSSKKSKNKGLDEQGKKIVLALGGWNNISAYNNCFSRLRYDIKDKKIVDEKALRAAGAFGLIWKNDNHIQIIVGTVADQLNVNIKEYIGSNLES